MGALGHAFPETHTEVCHSIVLTKMEPCHKHNVIGTSDNLNEGQQQNQIGTFVFKYCYLTEHIFWVIIFCLTKQNTFQQRQGTYIVYCHVCVRDGHFKHKCYLIFDEPLNLHTGYVYESVVKIVALHTCTLVTKRTFSGDGGSCRWLICSSLS